MSVIADPLALYGRLIDKGVDHALARALSDALHETPTGLATEASVNELRDEVRQGFASVREESAKTNAQIAVTNARIDLANARIDALPNALFIRLGSLMVVLAGAIVTAQRLWPPH